MLNKIKFGTLIASLMLSVSVSAADTDPKSKHEGDFIKGLTKWKNTCSRCHEMRSPKEFNDEQWKIVVKHMKIRAGLTGEDARDILKYLQNSN